MTKRKPLDLLQKWKTNQYWIGQHPPLTRSALVVLARLLDRQNPKTGRCDPSANGLIEETGLCERSVRNAFKELEGRGALKRYRVTRRARNQFLIFSVEELKQNQQSTRLKLRLGGQSIRQPNTAIPAARCRSNRQRTAPETIKETIKKKETAENTKEMICALNGNVSRRVSVGIDLGEFERRIVKVFEKEGLGYEGLLMLPASEMEQVFEHMQSGKLSFGNAVQDLLDQCRAAQGLPQ